MATTPVIAPQPNSPLFDAAARLYLGTDRADQIENSSMPDVSVHGFGDNDRLIALVGGEVLHGGEGDDFLVTAAISSTLVGGAGSDQYQVDLDSRRTDSVTGQKVTYSVQVDMLAEGGGQLSEDEGILFLGGNLAQMDAARDGNDLVIAALDGSTSSVRFVGNFVRNTQTGLDESLLDVITWWGPVPGGGLGIQASWSAADILQKVSALPVVTSGDDLVFGKAGGDVLDGGLGNDTMSGLVGNDVLNGGQGDDSLNGDKGDDTLSGDDGNDTLRGGDGLGQDVLNGGAGNDVLWGQEFGGDVLNGGAGDDTLSVVYRYGGSRDTLDGGEGDDLYDLLSGAFGATVRMAPTSGHDTLRSAQAFNGRLLLDGVSSADLTLQLVNLSSSGGLWSGSLPSDRFDLVIGLRNSSTTLTVENFMSPNGQQRALLTAQFGDGSQWTTTEFSARLAQGTAGGDVLVGGGRSLREGGEGNDLLLGISQDTLRGDAGNDTLIGGGSNVLMAGGAGSDLYVLDGAKFWGNAAILDVTSSTDPDGLDTEVLVFRNVASSDMKFMRDGNDLVAVARDYVQSTDYNSLRILGNFTTNSQGLPIGLTDQIDFADGVSWHQADILAAIQAANAPGTAGDDVLRGDPISNVLDGLAGNDTLYGHSGPDVLNGGEGDDVLYGGISGDTLDGGTGADMLVGGDGDDHYYVDSLSDQVIEQSPLQFTNAAFKAGRDDTVATNLADYTLPSGVENLVMGGKAGDSPTLRSFLSGKAGVRHGVGNDLNNRMMGDLGSENLEGGTGNDTLQGNGGNDTLSGGIGYDLLEGGDGNDTYILTGADTQDEIRELDTAESGVDTVVTDARSYTAAANIEQVLSTGVVVNGNQLNNLLRGNAGLSSLSGMAGDDTLEGAGNDEYRGGSGNDLLVAAGVSSRDVYVWSRDDGADIARDAGSDDRLIITGAVMENQLWFSRTGDDLKIAIIGTADSLTVAGWYEPGADHQIERITLTQGRDLAAGKVQQLVDAMASFTPPAQGQTTLPADVAAQLAPVIAAAWA